MLAPSTTEIRPIRVLPPEVAEQIAAGEVVERPVSVVRELIDNALDAGATDIGIELLGGGLELIRVADNGHGIPADQVELAFARHATSKIASTDDLRALQTLGFRGEALPSVATVAEVSLATRTREAAVGTLVVANAHGVARQQATARQPGTTVRVHQLFANVPARRKLMGDVRAESSLVIAYVHKVALGNPGIRFRLTIDGRPRFASRGLGDPRAALADVYGSSIAVSLRAFSSAAGGIDGYISPRTVTRADRQQVTLLVNGRLTNAPKVLAALEAAYRPVLPRGRHPVALLRLTQPLEEVDSNVHPAKAEVRLRREAEVAECLATAVRGTLAKTSDRPAADEDFALGAGQLSLPRPRHRLAERPMSDWGRDQGGQGLAEALLAPRGLAQVQRTLVLVEAATGLFLVDQHRAHERVIYERLRASSAANTQTLLEPIVLELKPHQVRQIVERLPALQALGFDCQHFGGQDFLLRAIPAVGGGEDFVEDLSSLMADAAGPEDRWRARLLARLACRAAIRRGRELAEHELRRLLADLAATTAPAVCPHGSPVVLHFSGDFLRRQFRW
jgi:DNA mismatch repair protein MutL